VPGLVTVYLSRQEFSTLECITLKVLHTLSCDYVNCRSCNATVLIPPASGSFLGIDPTELRSGISSCNSESSSIVKSFHDLYIAASVFCATPCDKQRTLVCNAQRFPVWIGGIGQVRTPPSLKRLDLDPPFHS
jgi:hypothetical protein